MYIISCLRYTILVGNPRSLHCCFVVVVVCLCFGFVQFLFVCLFVYFLLFFFNVTIVCMSVMRIMIVALKSTILDFQTADHNLSQHAVPLHCLPGQ